MSSLPERPNYGELAPPRLLVAVPRAEGSRTSRGRRVATAAILAGLVLGAVAIVVALLDRSGSSTAPRGHQVVATPRVVLPVVLGSHLQLAESVLQSEGFPVKVHTVSGRGPSGMVVGETPTGGRPIAKSTRVILTVSGGS